LILPGPAAPGSAVAGPAQIDPGLYDDAQEKMDYMKTCFFYANSKSYSLVVSFSDL
jgi:hypothetical protein